MKIKNWADFQHYKSGKNSKRPEWIKLYRKLLDDLDWHELPGLDAKVLLMLWLIGAENGGELPAMRKIAFRLHMPEADLSPIIQRLGPWLDDVPSDFLGQSYAPTRLEEKRTEENRSKDTSYPLAPDGADALSKAFDAYNDTAKSLGLPLARALDPGRRKHLAARLKTYGLAAWMQALENLRALPFCLGENDKGWRASFDFLIQAKSFPKVLEMQYGGKAMSRSKRATLKLLEEAQNGNGGPALSSISSRSSLLEFSKSTARCGDISGQIGGRVGRPDQGGIDGANGPADGLCIEGAILDDSRGE